MLRLKHQPPAWRETPGKQRAPLLSLIRGRGKSRTYHIDWDATLELWDVLNDEGELLGSSHELSPVLDLAIRSAERDHGDGLNALVCVQQPGGGYGLAWSSPPA
jgi:hypothetical protein